MNAQAGGKTMLLRRIDLVIGIVEKAVISVGLGAFFLIVPFITVDVILRYFFNKPILGSLELSEIAMATLLFLCIGYVTRVREHFAVELVASRFPLKGQVMVERFGYLIGLVVCALIVWQGTKMGIQMWHRNELTPLIHIPRYAFRLLLPLGAFFCCLELILQFAGSISSKENRDPVS